MNDEHDKPRSAFEDGTQGTVLKKKRRRVDVGSTEPRTRRAPTCKLCSGAHPTRSCRMGT